MFCTGLFLQKGLERTKVVFGFFFLYFSPKHIDRSPARLAGHYQACKLMLEGWELCLQR